MFWGLAKGWNFGIHGEGSFALHLLHFLTILCGNLSHFWNRCDVLENHYIHTKFWLCLLLHSTVLDFKCTVTLHTDSKWDIVSLKIIALWNSTVNTLLHCYLLASWNNSVTVYFYLFLLLVKVLFLFFAPIFSGFTGIK